MQIDEAFVRYLGEAGYHPRSSRHSDSLSELIIESLLEQCSLMRERATRGELVAKLRHHQQVGHDDWVVDVALGTCAGKPVPPPAGTPIRMTAPAIIQVAIELKSILTEHGKARRNRLRDFIAFHGYAHQYSPRTVAAAFLVVNGAQYFYSPLRKPGDVTKHAKDLAASRRLAHDAVNLFRAIPLRNTSEGGPGLEAIGIIVVQHDNLAFHPRKRKYGHVHQPSCIAPIPPSLPVGDPMHHETMIQRICAHYMERFR